MKIRCDHQQGRYYDAGYKGVTSWYIAYISSADFEPTEQYDAEEEFDVMARNVKHARSIARAVLARDFEDGVRLVEVVLA